MAQKFGFFVKLMKNKIRDLFEASSEETGHETLLKKFTERERERERQTNVNPSSIRGVTSDPN